MEWARRFCDDGGEDRAEDEDIGRGCIMYKVTYAMVARARCLPRQSRRLLALRVSPDLQDKYGISQAVVVLGEPMGRKLSNS